MYENVLQKFRRGPCRHCTLQGFVQLRLDPKTPHLPTFATSGPLEAARAAPASPGRPRSASLGRSKSALRTLLGIAGALGSAVGARSGGVSFPLPAPSANPSSGGGDGCDVGLGWSGLAQSRGDPHCCHAMAASADGVSANVGAEQRAGCSVGTRGNDLKRRDGCSVCPAGHLFQRVAAVEGSCDCCGRNVADDVRIRSVPLATGTSASAARMPPWRAFSARVMVASCATDGQA